jgi:hypothetical protein
LTIVCAVVDEDDGFSITFVDGTGPVGVDGKVEAIKRNAVERAAFHVPGPPAFALAT